MIESPGDVKIKSDHTQRIALAFTGLIMEETPTLYAPMTSSPERITLFSFLG